VSNIEIGEAKAAREGPSEEMAWHGEQRPAPRERILKVVCELFTQRGVRAVGMQQVVDESGLGKSLLSARMLGALRDNAARLGFTDPVAPVRHSGKYAQIHQPIDEYACEVRADGVPWTGGSEFTPGAVGAS
jgi:hypothetical protein